MEDRSVTFAASISVVLKSAPIWSGEGRMMKTDADLTMIVEKGNQGSGKWIEPWYFSYALQGVAVAGLIPILEPVFVNRMGDPIDVGFVMAAFSLGGLTAPFWGELADRHRLHRLLLAGGLLLTGLALVALAFSTSLPEWLILAFLQGSGYGAAATVASLFVVENHPKAEWDERIGWLQTFYGAGQVGGLLLSAWFTGLRLRNGLLLAAGFNLLAFAVGYWEAPSPANLRLSRPVLRHPARTAEWPVGSLQRSHHVTLAALRQLRQAIVSAFGVLLLAWMLSYAATAIVFSQYPVLMHKAYGISSAPSSLAFGAAAALGLLLYAPAGHWSDRVAPRLVLQAGLTLRLIAIVAMILLLQVHWLNWVALVAFAVIVLAWSLLSVSSTGLVARISPVGEGSGLGIFNAATAVAGVIGAAGGGWVAGRWGYRAALELAVAGTVLGLLLTFARGANPSLPESAPGAGT
jgi:DHA1 family tetracycline resistance protein-like MFS transporter